jgi:hypothetical protein
VADRAPLRKMTGLARPRGQEYSRKVQQPAWIPGDWCGRRGTVTCTDGLRWTSCRWMACKRSGVRIPVAQQLIALIRNLRRRIAGLYSSKVQQRRRMSSRESVRIRSPHGAFGSSHCADRVDDDGGVVSARCHDLQLDAAVIGADPDQAGIGRLGGRDLDWSNGGDYVHRAGDTDTSRIARSWLPSVPRGWLFPPGECAPVRTVVKRRGLDNGCDPPRR